MRDCGGRCVQQRCRGKLVGFVSRILPLPGAAIFAGRNGVTGATTLPFARAEASGFSAFSSTRFGFSVMIVCFLGVFSFLSSGCCAASARSAFHSAQRSEMVEMKWTRRLQELRNPGK